MSTFAPDSSYNQGLGFNQYSGGVFGPITTSQLTVQVGANSIVITPTQILVNGAVLDTDDVPDTTSNRYLNLTNLVDSSEINFTEPVAGQFSGELINASIANARLVNDSVTYNGVNVALGASGSLSLDDIVTGASDGDILYFDSGAGGWQRLAAGAANTFLEIDPVSGLPSWEAPGGPVLTISNLGTGANVASAVVSGDAQFRSIIGGTNLTATQNTNDVTLDLDDAITVATSVTTPLITRNGNMTISATGTNHDLTLTATDDITLFASGNCDISGTSVASLISSGRCTVQGSTTFELIAPAGIDVENGVGVPATIRCGTIENAATTADLTIDATRDVLINADDDVIINPTDNLALQAGDTIFIDGTTACTFRTTGPVDCSSNVTHVDFGAATSFLGLPVISSAPTGGDGHVYYDSTDDDVFIYTSSPSAAWRPVLLRDHLVWTKTTGQTISTATVTQVDLGSGTTTSSRGLSVDTVNDQIDGMSAGVWSITYETAYPVDTVQGRQVFMRNSGSSTVRYLYNDPRTTGLAHILSGIYYSSGTDSLEFYVYHTTGVSLTINTNSLVPARITIWKLGDL